MLHAKLVLSVIVSSLFFSTGSVASVYTYSQGALAQNVLISPGQNDIDSRAAIVTTSGLTQSNGLAEFARQVSSFQHESGGTVSTSVVDTSTSNGSIESDETGTFFLIALGCAALGLSRRRIKLAGIAGNQVSSSSEVAVGRESTSDKRAQHHLFTGENKTADAEASAGIGQVRTDTSKAPTSVINSSPYPELAESVHKLEALAYEMAHRR